MSEEEFRVVLGGLIAGGLLFFGLVLALAAIRDRIRIDRETRHLAETFEDWDR